MKNQNIIALMKYNACNYLTKNENNNIFLSKTVVTEVTREKDLSRKKNVFNQTMRN